MCLHNYTLHNGCGHKTPCPGPREYTLCSAARARLPRPPAAAAAAVRTNSTNSTNPPPPPPPKDDFNSNNNNNNRPYRAIASGALNGDTTTTASRFSTDVARPRSQSPQKRRSVLEKRASKLQRLGTQYMRRRIPSLSIGGRHGYSKSESVSVVQSGQGQSHQNGRTAGGVGGEGQQQQQQQAYYSPPVSPFDEYAGVSPLDVAVALCEGDGLKVVEQREQKMDVCERCKKVLNEMRWLVQAYDEKRNIKGCRAYWYVDVKRPDDPGTADWAVEVRR